MITQSECRSSYYATYYVVCPICKERAGYHVFFDTKTKKVFKCHCGKGLKQIKKGQNNEKENK